MGKGFFTTKTLRHKEILDADLFRRWYLVYRGWTAKRLNGETVKVHKSVRHKGEVKGKK